MFKISVWNVYNLNIGANMNTTLFSDKTIRQVIKAKRTQDGDGVKIHRIAGQAINALLDPFLMLDEIKSDDSADYIGGFPPHPHRGFETITYMLVGKFRHQDSMGNEGVIGSGGVQWMTAAHGVIHSEMPEQQGGQLHGFQLWLNLPADEKMSAPAYQDISAQQIPHICTKTGVKVTAIAGDMVIDNEPMSGLIQGKSTQPIIYDLELPAQQCMTLRLPHAHHALVYVFEGATEQATLQHMAFFGEGENITLHSKGEGARLLLLAGKPIKQPIVQQGPFVMNTMAQINQAIFDYQHGKLLKR
jgi:quercetin 2,3-dioxygenase